MLFVVTIGFGGLSFGAEGNPAARDAFIRSSIQLLHHQDRFLPAQDPQLFQGKYSHFEGSGRFLTFKDGEKAFFIVRAPHLATDQVGDIAIIRFRDNYFVNDQHHCSGAVAVHADQPAFESFVDFRRQSGFNWEQIPGAITRSIIAPIDAPFADPKPTPLVRILFDAPLQILVTLLLLFIGLYHFLLSVRSLRPEAVRVSPQHHLLLLLAVPSLVFLFLCVAAPSSPVSLGWVVISSMDPAARLDYSLLCAAAFGTLGLVIFVVNFLVAAIALHRQQSGIAKGGESGS